MRIVVVGDVLLDVDMIGAAHRLSPDAPVPVIEVEESLPRAGGAGLVATMLARDGHEVRLVTVLSDDRHSATLRECLDRIDVVAGPSGAPTPVKTRVRADGHAIARIDEGCAPPPTPAATDEMLDAIATADAIVVADYGRGVTRDPRLRAALDARAARVPLVWDPHPAGEPPVPNTALATPNLAEARAFSGVAGRDVAAAADAARLLREKWGVATVAVTMSERGALLVSAAASGAEGAAGGSMPVVVPAPLVATGDPCGAGDRLAATALAAVRDAVAAAAEYVDAGGVATLVGPPAARPIGGHAASALQVVRATRASGGTVVATGGCFDLVHAGHARTLAAARALGDCLVVLLNSDDSVRRIKGPERPIMTEEDRVDLLMSLGVVDAVVLFSEDTPEEALRSIKPDLWVKGGDYRAEDLPESAVIAEWGGQAVTVPYHPGRSTTKLAGALARVG
ncbi:PfkB family carbohydrate kinase [Clavibacter michiganensis]|uniref:PfkB family carbohydrate kinase n=1 Tax=Clavibacter michiganensis TaxID=28447 RepID=UPI00049F5E85|nr:PfkB family carbohydrate kinase [Clavibacter michiganensis]KDP92178.1 cytidyltransferase [Clavibacter cf. michiganensis LMG 26808]